MIRLHKCTLFIHPSRQLNLHPDPIIIIAAQRHKYINEPLKLGRIMDQKLDEIIINLLVKLARNPERDDRDREEDAEFG